MSFQRVFFAALMTLGLGAPAAFAEREVACPTYITYANGSYLKSGDYFLYANGAYLRSGSYVLYPNGSYLKSGDYLLYPSGTYLKSGSYLLYPNGSYLKSGDYLLYPNGSYLKSGSYFLYDNGAYARSGSQLYRRDGSTTAFPVTLTAPIGDFGNLSVEVGSDYESYALSYTSLISSPEILRSELITNGNLEITGLRLTINSGQPNENVLLTVDMAGNYTCSLSGGGQPSRFTLDTNAATVEVRVKDGYDPRTVRDALQRALDAL